ncbi:MAG: hypothetical protein GTN98_01360 [Woeseiaceae bacterium]|nr:hypothetical protein [Woeseiaceae bacterium]
MDFLQQNWALVAASVIGLAIALFLSFRGLQDSRRGRLGAALQHMRERERALAKAASAADAAAARFATISAKGDSVPPNRVLAAKDALIDAQETERLLKDQVLVVRNNVRTIILEEYPPKRHEALLRKWLRESR